jgi:murein DD-endopeptidase MepM/ murein hydrolase activator NlpD
MSRKVIRYYLPHLWSRWRKVALPVACLLLGLSVMGSATVSASQGSIPQGWLTYRNPIWAYTISYPSSWHIWGSDPRISQYLSNYDEKAAGDDFPAAGAAAKVEVSPFQKSPAQSLDQWLRANDAELSPGFQPVHIDIDTPYQPPAVQSGLTISGYPATTLRWQHANAVYFDAGNVAYEVIANWSADADSQLANQVLASFTIAGKADLVRATIPSTTTQANQPLVGIPSPGLILPMKVDYAWCCWMSTAGMNGGGVNSWYDHDSSGSGDYHCDNSLTRYDGAVYSPNWCSNGTGSCSTSVSCYDGHPGIDFSTDSQTGIPVYAANGGTVSTYSDSACGTGLYLSTTVNGHSVKILHCHLSSRIVSSGSVSRGQEIALSGCTGTGCGGPHLHFAVYRVDISPSHRADPFGWCGGGSDPDTYDIGYMWSTGSSCSPSPSFIGGPLYTVSSPGLSSGWSGSQTDAYGVTYWYSSTSGATATWNAPVIAGKSCYGAEVWIPGGNATNTNAPYLIQFNDGTSSTTTHVNQNANTSWYTIIDGYTNGGAISTITLTAASGSKTGAAKVWFQCF